MSSVLDLQRVAGNQAVARYLQPRTSAPGDMSEGEADAVAESVEGEVVGEGDGQAPGGAGAIGADVGGGADEEPRAVAALAGGANGAPLTGPMRDVMERRLGGDLSAVRIHTGVEAHGAASSIGALAFTVGQDIAFRHGEYRPETPEGRNTLAHELAHVVQQRGSAPRVQRQVHRPDRAKHKPTGHKFHFRVVVKAEMSREALLVEFARQYHHLETAEEAQQQIVKQNWRWLDDGRAVTKADVALGYVVLPVTLKLARTPQRLAESAQIVSTMTAEQKKSLNERTDAAFYEATGTPKDTKLGKSELDQEQAAYWLQLRSQLLDLDALSPEVKGFLFDPAAKRRLDPHDYAIALRVAKKVEVMTPAQRADYKSKVNAETTDWNDLDTALDRYKLGVDVRENQAADRAKIKTRLTGHLGIYKRVKAFRVLERTARSGVRTDREGFTYGVDRTNEVVAERAALTAELKSYNYDSIEAFEAMCAAYEQAFVKETAAIADDMLARYEHVLWEQERRYKDQTVARGIHQRVQASGASTQYQEARDLRSTATMIAPDLGGYARGDVELKARLRAQADAAESAADAAVRGASPDEPLVAESGFDREKLASADESEVQSMLTDYIAERRSDIAKARRHLRSDPELIFKLDLLYTSSLSLQQVESGSIYYEIVNDRREQIHRDERIISFLLAILAVAAGLLTMGTGTVAVVAAVAAVGIGAYGALHEFEKYDRESAAFGAKLLSEKPWMGWCVIAVIGLGMDVAATGTALRALEELAPAVKTLEETGNLVEFDAKLAKIAAMEKRVKDAVQRAGELEVQSKSAWRAILRPPQYLRSVLIPGLEEFGRFVWAVFLNVRKGAEDLSLFLKRRQLEEWYEALAPEMRTAVQEGHIAAVEAYRGVLKHADTLGMSESDAAAFLKHWGEVEPGLDQAAVEARMTAWAGQRKQAQALAAGTGSAEDVPFGFRDAEHWHSFKATAKKELDRALKGVDREGEAFLQGSSVSGVSYKRKLPFDAESDFDVAVTGKDLFKKARKANMEVTPSPSRIGPLSEDEAAELGLGPFVKKLRRNLQDAGEGFDREVKIMLFQDVEAARKPLGEASTEALRPTIPLTD